jgi:hypothetical protein
MKRTYTALAIAAALAGCGGTTTSAPSAQATAPARTTAGAQMTITIPAPLRPAGAHRGVRYVSSATNSLTVAAGGNTAVVPLTTSSPGCATAQNGSRTCVVQLALPVGQNVAFTVSTFASADGSGPALSIAVATTTVVAAQANPIDLTLNAVVGSLQVNLSPAAFNPPGQASSATVNVNVLDPASQIIVVGANNLVDASDSPVTITLSDTDASGATQLSSTTLGTAPIMLSYNGGTPSPGAAVVATAKNAASVVVTSTSAPILLGPTPTPSPTPVPAVSASPASLSFLNVGAAYAQTFAVSQNSYAGPFTATTSGGDPTVATTSVSGGTITVVPQHSGGTSVVVTGGFGKSVTVPVGVTVTPITIHSRTR